MYLKLYEFKHQQFDNIDPDLQIDYIVHVLSTLDSENVRKFYNLWDCGDTDYEIYVETMLNGTVKEIKSLEELTSIKISGDRWLKDVKDILPYDTGELVNCEELGGRYLYMDITIEDFFLDFYGVDFQPSAMAINHETQTI